MAFLCYKQTDTSGMSSRVLGTPPEGITNSHCALKHIMTSFEMAAKKRQSFTIFKFILYILEVTASEYAKKIYKKKL